MNREETREAIKVMQHYADGGEVERDTGNGYRVAEVPGWNWKSCRYRIKPEPNWVPLDAKGMNSMLGRTIKNKWSEIRAIVVEASGDECVVGSERHSSKSLLANWQHLDGSPVGRLEGES